MASRVVMPKLTDTMEEGLIIKWYKQEGDPVESGDVLAEIETDKAVMDLEAYASGIMRKILASADTKVPAGNLIAVIAKEDEDISAILTQTSPKAAEKKAQTQGPAPSSTKTPQPSETATAGKSPFTPQAWS